MNPLLRWLTSPEWTHVVGALLHSLWQGAIIAIALAVLMRRLTNPVTRYRCALGMLGGLVIAGIITWAVLNAPQPAAPVATPIPVAELNVAPGATLFTPDTADKVIASGKMASPPAPTHWTAWLALAWMVGTTAMLLRAGIKVAGAEKLRRSCKPLNDESMIALVAEACRAVALARRIRVAVTDRLTSPAVVGVIVPTLILPLSLFSTLTPEQIRFILLHELAHIRRGDYLANLFQLFAEALLFFNPAVWWISHQIRREREACCDALAIELSGAPADYARTLVRVAENILQPTPTAAIAFGEDGREASPLADRVQRLLVPGYRPALRLTWRAMLAALLFGGALLVLSAVGTRNTVGAILTSNQPTSPVLLGLGINPDMQPRVSGGNSNIQTTLIPTLTEFVGYDLATAATFVPTPLTGTGQGIDSVLPLPIFRVRQISTSHNVGDGQTSQTNELGLHSDNVAKIKDKVPFLGDLPLVGKLFTSESSRLGSVPTIRANDSFDIDDWTVTENEQLNKQWFWYRGGDTITWPTTTATAEPLAERTFEVDLGLFYAAVRKSAGLSETVTGTNLFSAVRSYFTNAGVNLDPASGRGLFLSTSRGDMWVRATAPELDAIEALLRPMPGTPLTRRSYHFDSNTLAKVMAVLSPEISSIVSTNPAAGFRALLESFNPNDPRPKQVRYFAERDELYARATEADFAQFELAMKGTLRLKPAPDTRTRATSSEATNLFTRTFQVEPGNITQAIEATAPQFKPATATNITDGLRALLQSSGANLSPPKSIYYNDRAGGLFVRATKEDLEAIESLLQIIGRQPAQVNLKVRWVEVPQAFASSTLMSSPTNALPLPIFRIQKLCGVLTDKQTTEVLDLMKSRNGFTLLNEGQITTQTERQAQLQVVEMKTVVTSINPKALTEPGVSSTNLLITQNTPLGPVVDIFPSVSADETKISLHTIATITEFLGYEKTDEKIPVYVNGQKTTTTFPQPKYRVLQMTNDCVILDGQTLVLGNPTITEVTKTSDGTVLNTAVSDTKTNLLFVFITATLVDSAGNPTKLDMGLPSKLVPSSPVQMQRP